MRGVALSDLHLGFRAYSAQEHGRNQREIDVEEAWFAAVQKITEIGPDIVTIAGDIFHHPRVSDYAKKAFISGLHDIALDCHCPIIVLQGNHDAGKTADVLTPIMLPTHLIDNLYVVTEPKRLVLPRMGDREEGVAIACFPFVARGDDQAFVLEPDPGVDVNILLMHAAVKGDGESGELPHFYVGDTAIDIGKEAEKWDVVAVGDYHEFTMLHGDTCAFYSGSLERTSNNIWQEEMPKGFVEWEVSPDSTFDIKFHEIPTRPMIDIDFADSIRDKGNTPLPPNAENVNKCMELWLLDVAPDIDDCLMRLKIEDFPREEREHIDWAMVRKLKNRCTHFYLDIRYAQREVVTISDRREDGERKTLAEEAVAFFADDDEVVRNIAFHHLEIEPETEKVTP